MSLSSDFFRSGGGGFALGLDPIASSATFKDMGNTYIGNELGEKKTYTIDRGRLAPFSDSVYDALSMDIRSRTDFDFSRGRLADRNSVFVKDQTNFGTDANLHGIVYDSVDGFMYLLIRDGGTGKHKLFTMNMTTGVVGTVTTDIVGHTAISCSNVGGGRKVGSNFVFYIAANNNLYRSEVTSGGVIVGTTDIAQSNGVDVDFSQWPHYVTADETITATEFSAVGGDRQITQADSNGNFLRFVLSRGSSQKAVVVPFDGSVPFAVTNPIFDVSSNGMGLGTAQATTHVIPWGADSVLSLANNRTGAVDHREVYGKKVFDSIDFDRWLAEVADFYNMPAGEAYWI